MPYSDNTFDNNVLAFIKRHMFHTYLDVGAGAGKYGKIIRSTISKAKITAIEPDKSYIKKFKLKKIYDEIITERAEEYLFKLPNFSTDVCIIGDCIEHIKKSDGINLINFLLYRTHYIIIVFPKKFLQFSYQNHDLEAHISHWSRSDFKGIDHKYSKIGFMNMVIIKGFLGDIDAIGKKKIGIVNRVFHKLFNKKINNEAFR